MADTDTLVREHLRHSRGQLDRIETRLDTTRLGRVERSAAEHAVQLAEVNIELDRQEARIARIEKKLDLVEI